jgi:EAL domain-containing protein (putative c-di-GMP-specific phosphodiesterase class I)
MAKVLLVDHESASLVSCSWALRRGGLEVSLAGSRAKALQLLDALPFDVIVSDASMPGMDGLQLVRALRERDLDVPVVLITADPAPEPTLQAMEQGAYRYLTKPLDERELAKVVSRAARLNQLARLKREALRFLGDRAGLLVGPGSLQTKFSRALASLWMCFQPIVSWRERRLYGYESLARSDEPSLATAEALLDAAERLDRLGELGRAVRARAAAAFQDAPTDALLFVNLHPAELEDADLYDRKAPLSILADRVVLEITERASLEHVPEVASRVRSLRRIGFRIAVDHPGAGHAGPGHFARLEPDVVKVDMSLVRDVDRQPNQRSVVRSILAICEELGLIVVCEGIETLAERDALAGLGCDLLQGYLFSRPVRTFPVRVLRSAPPQ